MIELIVVGVVCFCAGYIAHRATTPVKTVYEPLIPVLEPQPDLSTLEQRTKALTDQISTRESSGEYKRHWVYAQLIKEFPDVRKRDIAFAIEKVLQ